MLRQPRSLGPAYRVIIACAVALAATLLGAMDWPIDPQRLAASFGTPAKGGFVAGIALAGDDALVRSAEEGEVAFALDADPTARILPSTLGSFLIVEQGRGLAAVYSHLAPGSVATHLVSVKAGEVLGRSGDTGWADGKGIVFQLLDREEEQWVNPLLLLPALSDGKAPLLRSVALVRGGKSYVLGETAALPQGTYAVAVDAYDASDAPWTAGPLAPFSIRLSVGGAEIAKAVFDVAKGRGGRLELFAKPGKTFSELRSADGRYLLAERLFARGRSLIEVRVEDAAGNRRTASWSVSVE
jgi:murein DD-endopeptidase MepM/ murein hydrolase activator NlpD